MKILIETKSYKAVQYSDRIDVIGKADSAKNRNEIILESVLVSEMNIGYAIRFALRYEKYNS